MERAGASSSGSMGSTRRAAAAAAASMASSSSSTVAGVDTRKRKRGALQDISNTSKKIAEATARGIVKKERGSGARTSARASAKPPTAPTQTQAARAPLRAAGSRINSGRSSGNVVVKKEKTDALPKKRKHEAGAENLPPPAPHQKVQSLLTFQTTSRSTRSRTSASVSTRSGDAGASRSHATAQTEVSSPACHLGVEYCSVGMRLRVRVSSCP